MGTNKTLNELLPWLERTKRQDLYPTQLLFTDVLPWLQKLPADFDTILDIGCGPGFMSAFFYTRGHKVVACDPWDRFQFKDIIEYHKATAEVFKEKKFDAILLSHVLEHIPDVKTFMDEIKYLLNDNGYLFILLPVSLKVENGHWWQGWSLPQLGMHLAAHGFDCSKGIFQLCGNYSACGFGRLQKNMEFDINFNVKNMLSRLPKKFEDLIIDEGWGYSLSTNAIYIDENKIERTQYNFASLKNYEDTIKYNNDIISNLNNEIEKYKHKISLKQNIKNQIYKRKNYPKWFIHFLCWFIPSSKNRKNLKKYISNSKKHINTIEDIEYIKNNINYNNYILWNILKIANITFQYQSGLKVCNQNLMQEREIVFDFDEAPADHKVRYHFAADIVDNNDEVLDIACGVGYGSELLARNAKNVLGIDLSNASVNFANKIFACRHENLTYKCADITCENIEKTFDKIICFETIEHIKDDRRFITKLRELLKNDGKLICSVPNETVLPFRTAGNSFHYRHYTIEEVIKLMRSSGFNIENLYFQYHDPEQILDKNECEGHTIICICKKIL